MTKFSSTLVLCAVALCTVASAAEDTASQAPAALKATPLLTVTPSTFTESAAAGSVSDIAFTLSNPGGGTLSARVTTDVPWITTPTEPYVLLGGTVEVPVQLHTAPLPIGTHSGTVIVRDESIPAEEQIAVTLTVLPSGATRFNFTLTDADWIEATPANLPYAGTTEASWDELAKRYTVTTLGKPAVAIIESPLIRPGAEAGPYPTHPERHLVAGEGALYEATWNFPPGSEWVEAPAVRLRAAGLDHKRVDMTIVSAEYRDHLDPVGRAHFTTSGYFPQQPTMLFPALNRAAPFRLFADVISSSPADGESTVTNLAEVYLRDLRHPVQGETIPEFRPLNGVWDYTLYFRNVAENYYSMSPVIIDGVYAAPERFEQSHDGFLIAGVTAGKELEPTSGTIVGSWVSDRFGISDDLGNGWAIRVPAGEIIKATWRIRTTATEAQRSQVPPFRLRIASDQLTYTYLTIIDSGEDGELIPHEGETASYVQYFRHPEGVNWPLIMSSGGGFPRPIRLDYSYWYCALDYIYTDGKNDDPSIGIIFDSLKLEIARLP